MAYWEDAGLVAIGAVSVALGTMDSTSGALAVGGMVLFGSFLLAVGLFSGLETAVRRGIRVPAHENASAASGSDDDASTVE
ncbi:hypothetical protein SAMN05216559_3867 [Halomicrobium zhouii]|uniref:Uncharacterized protein n=1 Tax=Halomicrobium zhouii TaxID=767519 RepID=A0A1I6M6X9_9EURY|nr:hypothetical protein [Halomicrobium zhouii]SFS11454.1 hypothetical protein SAMN05216559_3867 [Halomicrobium zhouii]